MPDIHPLSATDLNWNELDQTLDEQGYAKLPRLISEEACSRLIVGYEDASLYRKRSICSDTDLASENTSITTRRFRRCFSSFGNSCTPGWPERQTVGRSS